MQEKETLINDLTKGSVFKTLFMFSLPIMLANALQAVYNLVDMAVVGQFNGAVGLSAVGIGGQIQNVFLCVGLGFANGAQVVISQQVGLKSDRISKSVGTLLTLEFLMGLVVGAFGVFGHNLILDLMNTPEAARSEAVSYMVICSCGMVFIFEYNALCAILRGMGESKLPMVFIGCASVINVVLDLFFVGVMNMGAGGAALATVIAQGVACLCAIIYLYRHKEAANFDFKLRSFGLDKEQLMSLLRLGIPAMLQMMMIIASVAFVNSRINLFDVTASAVDSIGGKLYTVVQIVTQAIILSGASMIAQNFSAGENERVKKVVRCSFMISMTWFVIMGAFYLFLPKQIFGIFTTDQSVLEMAPLYCKIAIINLLGSCTMTGQFSLVRGIGFASFDLIVGILDGVVARIGLSVLFGSIMGLSGYWFGTSLAGYVTTILMGIYYLSGRWEKRSSVTK